MTEFVCSFGGPSEVGLSKILMFSDNGKDDDLKIRENKVLLCEAYGSIFGFKLARLTVFVALGSACAQRPNRNRDSLIAC